MGVDIKNELKAHDFKANNKTQILYNFCERVLKGSFSCASYIDNKTINPKFLHDKNATYNFLVKLAIERAIDKGIIIENSSLIIRADNRNIKTSYRGSIETYLRTQLIIEKNFLNNVKVDFIDSKNNWGIQIADFLSFYNFSLINKKITNTKQKAYLRKVH